MDVNSHFSNNPQNGASLIQRVAKNNKLPMKKEISKTNASTSEKEVRETCSKDIDKSKGEVSVFYHFTQRQPATDVFFKLENLPNLQNRILKAT